jgi:hypothetical protein
VLGVVDPLRETLIAKAGISSSSVPRSSDDLVLLTGGIIEFIAAAFLWVYRLSINQQTFYYRRQFRVHNALLAHQLSEKMQSRDIATTTIVERLLEDVESRDVPPPGTSGLAALLKRDHDASPS